MTNQILSFFFFFWRKIWILLWFRKLRITKIFFFLSLQNYIHIVCVMLLKPFLKWSIESQNLFNCPLTKTPNGVKLMQSCLKKINKLIQSHYLEEGHVIPGTSSRHKILLALWISFLNLYRSSNNLMWWYYKLKLPVCYSNIS